MFKLWRFSKNDIRQQLDNMTTPVRVNKLQWSSQVLQRFFESTKILLISTDISNYYTLTWVFEQFYWFTLTVLWLILHWFNFFGAFKLVILHGSTFSGGFDWFVNGLWSTAVTPGRCGSADLLAVMLHTMDSLPVNFSLHKRWPKQCWSFWYRLTWAHLFTPSSFIDFCRISKNCISGRIARYLSFNRADGQEWASRLLFNKLQIFTSLY